MPPEESKTKLCSMVSPHSCRTLKIANASKNIKNLWACVVINGFILIRASSNGLKRFLPEGAICKATPQADQAPLAKSKGL